MKPAERNATGGVSAADDRDRVVGGTSPESNPARLSDPPARLDPLRPLGLIEPGDPIEPDNPIAPRNPMAPADPRGPAWPLERKPLDRARMSGRPKRHAAKARREVRRVVGASPYSTKSRSAAKRGNMPAAPSSGRARVAGATSTRRWLGLIPVLIVTGLILVISNMGHDSSRPATPHTVQPSHAPAKTLVLAAPHAPPKAPVASLLAGVSMPNTGGGSLPLHPVRLLVNVDSSADVPRVDLGVLGSWIASHERHRSIVRLSTGRGARRLLSAALLPPELKPMPSTFAGTERQAQRWLRAGAYAGAERPVRLTLDIGSRPRGLRPREVRRGVIRLTPGAPVPSATAADPRRHDSITAAIALQIIKATGQSEREPPRLVHGRSNG
jgi:hypothetical protein